MRSPLIKSALVLMTVFGMSGTSFSQTHYSSNVSVGVKGGVDLSRVSFTPSVKQSFAMGGNAGITTWMERGF